MRVIEVMLTPKLAHSLLAVNDHNRHVRPLAMARWKGIYLRDEYRMTGETIKVRGTRSEPERLQDGQHRLAGYLAAVEERPDLTVPIMLAEGVPDEAQPVIDTGMKRSFADVLTWTGETQTVLLSAVINLSLKVERGRLIGTGGLFTYDEMMEHFNRHPYLREGVRRSEPLRKAFRGSAAGMAYAVAEMINAAGETTVAEFVSELEAGADLPAESPLLHMREQFLRWERQASRSGAGPLSYVVAASLIKCWNCWRRGDHMVTPRSVRWPNVANEEWPKAE